MPLSGYVADAIEGELAKVHGSQLARAATELSTTYRGARDAASQFFPTDAHRAAYLAVRFPATYAAIESALMRLRLACPDFAPETILDLGAGPGTATIAAYSIFPSLVSATLIERDAAMVHIARKLLAPHQTEFLCHDLNKTSLPQADLVMCAYTLNELSMQQADALLNSALSVTRQALVVVEPGSRDGFAHVLAARQRIINTGEFALAAPCPGEMSCPMAAAGDWCHFVARVQRTSLHRRLKDAALSYEDEKFSYVVGVTSQLQAHPTQARIVRRPEKLKGHVKLQLCTIDGLQSAVITKKQGASYKQARDAKWGDSFEPNSTRICGLPLP